MNGSVDKKRIDDAVSRVLKAKFELGLFENPYVRTEETTRTMNMDAHKAIAKQAALESIVLLKNEKQILPFTIAVHSIAVIGEDAAEARLGGYSGTGK